MEKLECSYIGAGIVTAILENSLAVPQKVKHRIHTAKQFRSKEYTQEK